MTTEVEPLSAQLLAAVEVDPAPVAPLRVTWHSVNLRTGAVNGTVDAAIQGAFGRTVGTSTSSQMDVLCWDEVAGEPVPGWEAATEPGLTGLVALDQDEQIVGGFCGMVLRRRRDHTAVVSLDLASPEAYLDRRYVTDHEFEQADEAVIVRGVLDGILTDGIALTLDTPDTGTRRDRAYADDDDKTLLSVLEDLMGVEGGPEFTIDTVWANDDHTHVEFVFRLRPRIGRDLDLPETQLVFGEQGNVTGFEYVEDYSSDSGANDVMATSSGEGESRPESAHMVAGDLFPAWPRYEHRFSPSTSIVELDTLNAHARDQLAKMLNGTTTLACDCDLDSVVLPGLGDAVDVQLTAPSFPARRDADGWLVPGYHRVVDAMGWEIDLDARTFKALLVEVG